MIAFAAAVAIVMVCVVYVDRPTAEFFERQVRHTQLWVWIARGMAPLDLAVLAALLFLLGCGAWVLSGRALASQTRIPLLCCWAMMWATAAQEIFNRVFGRARPDPT